MATVLLLSLKTSLAEAAKRRALLTAIDRGDDGG